MRDPQSSRPGQPSSEWFADKSLRANAETYSRYLTERGYAAGTIKSYVVRAAQFAQWLGRQRPEVADCDEEQIARFVNEHLSTCRCHPRCRRSPKEAKAALGHLLAMLRASGQCAPRRSAVPAAIAGELEHFDRYLVDVRGLAPSTRSVRLRHLRDFLIDRFGNGSARLSALGPKDVTQFVDRYTVGWTPASIKSVGVSLRSYFAYRTARGEQTTALAAALPRVAQWRLASLPPVLCEAEITRLLNAFDQSTATGKRDYGSSAEIPKRYNVGHSHRHRQHP